jgi:hypothetical protein
MLRRAVKMGPPYAYQESNQVDDLIHWVLYSDALALRVRQSPERNICIGCVVSRFS